jgi:hypothetical protein
MTHMQMNVPSRAPIRPTRSLKNGIASAIRKEMIQLNNTHELDISDGGDAIRNGHTTRQCSESVCFQTSV